MSKTKENNKWKIFLLVLIAFILGGLWTYLIMRQLNTGNTNIKTNSSKEYTVSENSIAPSVDKIYDATVVVETSKDGQAISTGTGFVYKKEGSTAYIMTNNHVIAGGDSARVIYTDGSSSKTKILGGDVFADIAVLTVPSSTIKQVATLGSTDNLHLGDTTFAVGSPLGNNYSGSVTKGILSGKDRLVGVSITGRTNDYYMKVLQTDAALNPGNSGGPLCDVNGEVIGVNSLKLTKEQSMTSNYSVEGMGFAIPIEDALNYADTIENGGSVERPYIGIGMLDITDGYYLWKAGISLPNGVKEGIAITEVVSASPADKAGLEKGDIIVKLNKTKVNSVAKLRYELYKYKPGEEIEITYNRDGKEKKTKVKLTKNKETIK